MRNALIKLFDSEEPVPENYKAGRQVLHSILGRDDIPIDKPVLCFATDPVLSAMAKPGVTPIVWETKARLATGGKTVLESMEGAGSECLMEFLGTFSYIPSTYFTVFVHTRTFKYIPVKYTYILTCFFVCAENCAVLDGQTSIDAPRIPATVELIPHNQLLAHLFYTHWLPSNAAFAGHPRQEPYDSLALGE